MFHYEQRRHQYPNAIDIQVSQNIPQESNIRAQNYNQFTNDAQTRGLDWKRF